MPMGLLPALLLPWWGLLPVQDQLPPGDLTGPPQQQKLTVNSSLLAMKLFLETYGLRESFKIYTLKNWSQ